MEQSKSCISVSSSPFLKCTFLVTESCVIKSINKTTECYSIYSHKNTVIKQKLSISEKAICYKVKLKGRRSRGTKSYFSLFFVAIVWSFHDLLLMRSRCDNSLWHNIELFTLYMQNVFYSPQCRLHVDITYYIFPVLKMFSTNC